jgi:membrane-bound serine protease (ClpP class)
MVFAMEIKGEINAASFKKLSDAIKEAKEINANYFVLHLNTYGGAVDAADSMRTALLNMKIPTAVFIDNQAVSAGALISIACDSIFMRKGGTIGAATVVNQTGEPMPDKYQSFMRAMMRSTAEVKGRDPHIAEAMVDPTIVIEDLIDSTKVLSFTSSEAITNGYCEGMAETLEEAVSLFVGSDNYILEKQKLSILSKILLFFMTPVVQGLLLMLMIGGLYFELQSPGIGFPSVAAIIAAVLYFSPLYLEGLAQNWEIIVFVMGILLILAEIFILPGFGVAGISGIILLITGLSFAMIDNNLFYDGVNFDFIVLIKPLSIVLLSIFLSSVLSVYLGGKLLKSNLLPKISLKTTLSYNEGFQSYGEKTDDLTGKTALVCTDMKPSGKVDIDGKWYEATLNMGTASKGEKVTIIRSEGGRLYCERLNQ